VTEDEEEAIENLAEALEISDDVAKKVLEVTAIRSRSLD
jgi:hypothetical protein